MTFIVDPEYKFNVGDRVTTKDGDQGVVCKVEDCYYNYTVDFGAYKDNFREEDLVMQNKLFVDTDGNPLILGSMYLDEAENVCTLDLIDNNSIIMEYLDQSIGRVTYYDFQVFYKVKSFVLIKSSSSVNKQLSQQGRKYDSGKPRYSLLPPLALEEVVHVLTFGSTKYEDFNWLKVENANDRYFSAANRHLWQWKRGEKLDDETKRHHLASAITNLMFILEMDLMDEQKQTAKE